MEIRVQSDNQPQFACEEEVPGCRNFSVKLWSSEAVVQKCQLLLGILHPPVATYWLKRQDSDLRWLVPPLWLA